MLKVLVTGASGRVGSCLVGRLKRREYVKLCALSRHGFNIADEKSISLTIESILPDGHHQCCNLHCCR